MKQHLIRKQVTNKTTLSRQYSKDKTPIVKMTPNLGTSVQVKITISPQTEPTRNAVQSWNPC